MVGDIDCNITMIGSNVVQTDHILGKLRITRGIRANRDSTDDICRTAFTRSIGFTNRS